MKTRLLACLALLAGAVQAQAIAQPLRDPFARPAVPVRALPAEEAPPAPPEVLPQLRAVMVTPGRALANINGQILATGEWFGDYQLTKVEERGVTLSKRGVKSVLLLDETRRK